MRAPGTAYDDPRLGKDPQPAHLRDYVETTDDNGGVHINSGIPNHAFYLVATAIGGHAWEVAGQVWFDVLTGATIAADCDFATFARLTVEAAESRYAGDSPHVAAVRDAWVQVGVLDRSQGAAAGDADRTDELGVGDGAGPVVPTPAQVVQVRRTGGFAGIRQQRIVMLDELPEEDAEQWRGLLSGDLSALAVRTGRPVPDAFTYHVACPPDSDEVDLPEPGLPGPVRDLLRRTLEG